MEEVWKEVPSTPGYAVSNLGRVKSLHRVKIRKNGRPCTTREKMISCSLDSQGYYQYYPYVNGKRLNVAVHRAVWEAFNGPVDLDVDHKDGDQVNNWLTNLQPLTRSDHNKKTYRQQYDKGFAAGYAQALKDMKEQIKCQ